MSIGSRLDQGAQLFMSESALNATAIARLKCLLALDLLDRGPAVHALPPYRILFMNVWNRFYFFVAGAALAALAPGLVDAQTKASAQDIQSQCQVADIPAIDQLSISWTGDCVDGKATGVGNVLGFGAGELRYILRGAFTAGRLTRLDDIQDCSSGRCDDKVASAVQRQHAVLYRLGHGQSSPPGPASPGAGGGNQRLSAEQNVAVVSSGQAPAVPAAAPVAGKAGVSNTALPATAVEIRAEDAVYKGRFLLDKKTSQISGEGRVEFFDGRSYEGRLEAGRKVGRGTHIWADGQRFSGEWLNDLPEGQGEWASPKGDRYVGGFRAGKRNGKGRMVYANQTEYDGEWQDDRPSGQGSFKFANGDVYTGQFVAGEQSGQGTLTHRNGDRHTGQWLKGMREGKGVAEWKDGQRYEGDWRANRKEGQGVMRFADGGSYDGAWVNDRPIGQGSIRFASGDVYTGLVREGLPQGKGLYTWGSGDKFEGDFESGRPTANGVMTFYIPPATEAAAAASAPASADGPAEPVAAAAVSPATLCSRAFNKARSIAALKSFMESFPNDECERHALARQKIAAFEENERKLAKQLAERQEQAKALVGLTVAYRQDYTHCVAGSDGKCQNVVYTFEVKGKIREVNIARQSVLLQITAAVLLGNDKGAPANLYEQGKAEASQAFKKRIVGSTQSKTEAEVGMQF